MVFVPSFVLLALSLLVVAIPQTTSTRAKVITHCTIPNTAALTFDDGPYIYLYEVSKQLKAANATGTFFFNGNNYECIYSQDSVKRIKYAFDQGHQVASHTWAHKDLTKLARDQIQNEMRRVEQALQKITGACPAFTRPPYGNYNNLVLDVAGSRGQTIVIWDFDSGDSIGHSVAQQKKDYSALVNRHPKTILALNHEVYNTTAFETLPYAINLLQKAGYNLVSLSECLGQPPYKSVAAPSTRTVDWHC